MPFTLAHPALAIPIKGIIKRSSITALVIGSMVPDFENFFQMREMENIGHLWQGILFFDLPVGFLACFLFQNLLKDPLVRNLPSNYRERCIMEKNFSWNKFAMNHKWGVLLSFICGLLSHLLWDAFTHREGIFVQLIPVLSYKIIFLNTEVPVHLILQVLSSIFGLLILQKIITRIPRHTEKTQLQRGDVLYWPLFLISVTVVISLRLYLWPWYNSFLGVLKAMMGALLYSWLFVSVLFNRTFLKRTSEQKI